MRARTNANSARTIVTHTPVPERVCGLLRYLSHPFERANEDLALAYFRSTFGEAFQRQADGQAS